MRLLHWTRWRRDQFEVDKTYLAGARLSDYWQGKLKQDWIKLAALPSNLKPLISTLDLIDTSKQASQGLRGLADLQLYSGELLKEYVFEEIRSIEFLDAPSRKQCLFCFDTSLDPHDYFREMKIETSGRLLIEIEGISAKSKHLRVMPSLLNCNTASVMDMQKIAKKYWAGFSQAVLDSEVLFAGEFQIKKVFETIHTKGSGDD